MKKLCVYYSRSGLGKEIADAIGKKGYELLEISDGKNYRGFFGYIKAAVTGLKKTPPVLLPYRAKYPLPEYEKILLAAPIWCEDICPQMRAFVLSEKENFKGKTGFIIHHMSAIDYGEKIKALEETLEKSDVPFLSVQTKNHDFLTDTDAFLEKFGEKDG